MPGRQCDDLRQMPGQVAPCVETLKEENCFYACFPLPSCMGSDTKRLKTYFQTQNNTKKSLFPKKKFQLRRYTAQFVHTFAT